MNGEKKIKKKGRYNVKIPITKPYFSEDEYNEIKETLDSGWLVQGPKVKKFEELFSKYTGVKYAKATSSCTTALHLGLTVLGVEKGQDVIVPSFTYIATPNSVEYTKATPIFCDIDLKTYNLDPRKVEEIIEKNYIFKNNNLVNKKTGNILTTILTVHQFGLASDIIELNKIATKYNLKILEDGACAVGARINNVHVGNFGNMCAFSFHPRKSITTGEGGMIVTNNLKEAELIEALRSHGATLSDLQRHLKKGYLLPEFNLLGYNYRMTDIQGAIGIHQMKKLDLILNRKKEIAKIYLEELKDLKGFVLPFVPKNYEHGWQSFVCRIDNDVLKMSIEEASEKRNKLMGELEDLGIATRQGTHASHTLGYYKNKYKLNDYDFINSYKADKLTISLPMYFEMTEYELSYVITNLKKGWKKIFSF
ncbi:DegT/DnrJ/EryC1/StrS aminotransferase [Thermosipho africanus Ob7]|nr:DegT/DnrJ/EryC1/StrS aminotransferase [Thermosipho africanus Ob7]